MWCVEQIGTTGEDAKGVFVVKPEYSKCMTNGYRKVVGSYKLYTFDKNEVKPLRLN